MKISGYIAKIFVLTLACFSLAGRAQNHSTTLVFPTKSHAPIRKATGTHLFFAVGTKTTVSNPQGTALAKLKVLDDPDAEDDDDELSVYGVNAGNNEIIYNTSLINIEIYRKLPESPGSLSHPRGITANRGGDVYVADMGHQRVVHLFNERGKQLQFRKALKPDAPDFYPFDVALAEDGRVFVSDSAGSRIWRWNPRTEDWTVLIESTDTPLGLTIYDREDKWTRYRQSQLGIITEDGKKVLITDLNGRKLCGYTPTEKNTRFRYIAADYYNNYYMTDTRNGRIVKIDRTGYFVDTIGEEGKDDYQFERPQGIAIWKRFGQVCIAESYAAQYYLIGTDILKPEITYENNQIVLDFDLTERADITLTVQPPYSAKEDTLLNHTRRNQGKFEYRWQPGTMKTGEYLFTIEAVPTYSSTKYFTATRKIRWTYQPNVTEPSAHEDTHE
ncbi:MAG: hypothetical protein MAGBODY4_00234 [Candidatus Marinimicrobia bacterium]|nr:hypothetical protein [Candidatus Neomarinimicrobiota bacterium]